MEQSEIIGRATRAERWLADETTRQAFGGVRAAILDELARLPVDDIQNLQRLKIMLGLLEKLKSVIELFVRDGKIAREALEKERNAFQRVKETLFLLRR